jgi:predicted ATP-grasp superfamily ATP-dependent carboligase
MLQDLAECPEVEPVTLVAPSLVEAVRTICSRIRVFPLAKEETPLAFRGHAGSADYSLIIAPETDGILATYCQWVEAAGGRLLGPCSHAVQLTGDKLALAKWLGERGISTPSTFSISQWDGGKALPFPRVVKPRHGAGSLATFVLQSQSEMANCLRIVEEEGWRGEMIMQPLLPGNAASVACLAGPSGTWVLPAAAQTLSDDGRFRYLGGRIPLEPALCRRADEIARRIAASNAGFQGYFGMDLLLGDSPEQDAVIEINPRLTTSYIGIRALARFNVAKAWLSIVQGHGPPLFQWHAGAVVFNSAGHVILNGLHSLSP